MTKEPSIRSNLERKACTAGDVSVSVQGHQPGQAHRQHNDGVKSAHLMLLFRGQRLCIATLTCEPQSAASAYTRNATAAIRL